MSVTYDFAGKVAFVTGAASGMGLATAQAFARSGASVALIDLSEEALADAAATLRDAPGDVLSAACDVTDAGQVAAAVERTVARFGSLDMAFNNAGIMNSPVDLGDETEEAFDRVTAINLRGVWAATKYELQQMRQQGSGSIVNCSSLGGLVGGAGRASYHATKHGVIGLTKSAALEYGQHGIRVNAICPGTIDTPMVDRMVADGELDKDGAIATIAAGRLGTSEEIAASVLWLASDASSYVTGVALPVDGGFTAQ